MDLHQHAAAADALRRVLYLDRSLALAHLSLGIVLRALGDLEGARRAFHDAHDISSAAPPDECVPLGDDEKAGDLAEFAKLQLDAVEKMTGDT